jgi:hypothetical protein
MNFDETKQHGSEIAKLVPTREGGLSGHRVRLMTTHTITGAT